MSAETPAFEEVERIAVNAAADDLDGRAERGRQQRAERERLSELQEQRVRAEEQLQWLNDMQVENDKAIAADPKLAATYLRECRWRRIFRGGGLALCFFTLFLCSSHLLGGPFAALFSTRAFGITVITCSLSEVTLLIAAAKWKGLIVDRRSHSAIASAFYERKSLQKRITKAKRQLAQVEEQLAA